MDTTHRDRTHTEAAHSDTTQTRPARAGSASCRTAPRRFAAPGRSAPGRPAPRRSGAFWRGCVGGSRRLRMVRTFDRTGARPVATLCAAALPRASRRAWAAAILRPAAFYLARRGRGPGGALAQCAAAPRCVFWVVRRWLVPFAYGSHFGRHRGARRRSFVRRGACLCAAAFPGGCDFAPRPVLLSARARRHR